MVGGKIGRWKTLNSKVGKSGVGRNCSKKYFFVVFPLHHVSVKGKGDFCTPGQKKNKLKELLSILHDNTDWPDKSLTVPWQVQSSWGQEETRGVEISQLNSRLRAQKLSIFIAAPHKQTMCPWTTHTFDILLGLWQKKKNKKWYLLITARKLNKNAPPRDSKISNPTGPWWRGSQTNCITFW